MKNKTVRNLLRNADQVSVERMAKLSPMSDDRTKKHIFRQVQERTALTEHWTPAEQETYSVKISKTIDWREIGTAFSACAACLAIVGTAAGCLHLMQKNKKPMIEPGMEAGQLVASGDTEQLVSGGDFAETQYIPFVSVTEADDLKADDPDPERIINYEIEVDDLKADDPESAAFEEMYNDGLETSEPVLEAIEQPTEDVPWFWLAYGTNSHGETYASAGQVHIGRKVYDQLPDLIRVGDPVGFMKKTEMFETFGDDPDDAMSHLMQDHDKTETAVEVAALNVYDVEGETVLYVVHYYDEP